MAEAIVTANRKPKIRDASGRVITQRAQYAALEPKKCELCGSKIAFYRTLEATLNRRFCSKQCCGRYHVGDRHGNWIGGILNEEGYMRRSVFSYPAEHRELLMPMRRTNRYEVPEHRAVMAIHLGRPLHAWETVHHRNGNKLDNNIENLELRVGPHGTGATAEALYCPHCHKAYFDAVA